MASLLHLLILLPLLAAVAVLLGAAPRRTALGAALATLVLSLVLAYSYDRAVGGFQFMSSLQVLPAMDLKYFLGCDGLNLMLLLLTAIVSVAAVCAVHRDVENPRMFYASLLFIAAGAFGAFASLDIFFFYIFHELALVPTFLLIGIWGGRDRHVAAWKITIYLALGSFILLLGLLGLYWNLPVAERTFDMTKLLALAEAGPLFAPDAQTWVYLLLLVGFGILISLFPFHSWAPDAYAAAPVPAAMLHAGVLKKFGLYGLIRIAQPLLPQGAEYWTTLLLVLLVGNILYVGFVTLAQQSLEKTLGYSSVMHMGYIFLGIAAFNVTSVAGASMLLFAHGLSIALLFALAGEIRRRTGSLFYADLGGLAKSAPALGFLFGLASFASIGLPGFANFSAEILVFFGAFDRGQVIGGFNQFQIATTCALWGVVLSAVYMLRAFRNIFMGETTNRCSGVRDLSGNDRWSLYLLAAGLVLIGFMPNLLLDLISTGLQSF